jgi:mannosyltransferase OCH1-like enzyme
MKYNYLWLFHALLILLLIIYFIIKRKTPRSIIENIFVLFVVVFYSLKNIYYGVLICVGIIFYYHCLRDNFGEGFDQKEDNNKIPKIIIQTWKTADIPVKYEKMVNSLKTLNPEYKYKFFSDVDIEKFLTEHYPDYLVTYKKLPIVIQKIDFFRYIAIYHFGGFYFDLDMNGLEPLDEMLLKNECVFPVDEIINGSMCKQQRYSNFCNGNMYFLLGQYAFGAKPKDPFIKLLIDTIHLNIEQTIKQYNTSSNKEIYVYVTTGPDFVSNLYMNYSNKNSIKILHNGKRQYFGKYAQHNFFGSWKQKPTVSAPSLK